jgi:hypothetical protein
MEAMWQSKVVQDYKLQIVIRGCRFSNRTFMISGYNTTMRKIPSYSIALERPTKVIKQLRRNNFSWGRSLTKNKKLKIEQ